MAPFLGKAKKEASKSQHRCFQHSAVIFKGGAILSTGFNSCHRHAEQHAINKLLGNAKDCVLLSIRVTKGGQIASAKPCPACEVAIRNAGIKKVLYSTTDRTIEEMKI